VGIRTSTFHFSSSAESPKWPILLWIALFFLSMLAKPVQAQTPGTFALTSSMSTARAAHTATLLADGQVLVAGGVQGSGHNPGLQSAEIYNPLLGQFSPTGSLNQGRSSAGAVLLGNGQVLVIGGISSGIFLTSAELFDPAAGAFTYTGSLSNMHQHIPAIFLNNSKVLFAGCTVLPPAAEVYDPVAGTFAPTAGAMVADRCGYANATLPDGRVLFAGGAGTGAEIYDPSTDSFSPTGNMSVARSFPAATPLPDGRILITGGQTSLQDGAEIYDPVSGSFSLASNMTTVRSQHAAIALSDGEILLALGFDSSGIAGSAELYHPSFDEFFSTGSLNQQRLFGTGTLLANGKVLLAGGEDTSSTATASAELYTPSPAWIAFSSFAADAKIHGGKKPSFSLNATAAPAANGYAINPPIQDLFVAFGTYSFTIPAGSFVYDAKHAMYNFSGVVQNVSLSARIVPQSNGTFVLSITGNGVDLTGNSNPIPLELHVGSDVGKTTVVAQSVG
jgi:hypothetical protein